MIWEKSPWYGFPVGSKSPPGPQGRVTVCVHVAGNKRIRGIWEEGTNQEEEILEENPRKLILLAENKGAERRRGVPLSRTQACA